MIDQRVVEVVEYDPDWIPQFLKEQALISNALSTKNIIAVHHIGSTSVTGLAAKPIIDILVEVESLDLLDNDTDVMTGLGYLAKGEFGIRGRRYFQKGGIQRSHHVHAFVKNSPEVKRHLAFRDYMREFGDVRNEYGELKRNAAKDCNNDIQIYMRLKNDFIKYHEAKAYAWKYS